MQVEHTVPSTSDEYTPMSWWAAHASRTKRVELIDEAPGHVPVWGLKVGAPPVKVPWRGKVITASARVQPPGVVGLSGMPATLEMLTFKLPPGVRWEAVRRAAQVALEKQFGTPGINVYFTRKMYESVEWVQYGTVPLRPIDSVKLSNGVERELLEDAREFIAGEADYVRLGRPYKRVYCLYGPPGTGKTSLVMAIASELRRPLAIFNMDSLRDDTFIDLLTQRPPNAVLLFEDVDALFRGRAGTGGGMTFSTLLNALDGVLHPRGALVFLTTNHLDRLDAALRRPGRVDKLVEVPPLTTEQAADLWRAIFPNAPPPMAALRRLAQRRVAPALVSQELFARRKGTPAEAARALAALVGQ